MVTDRRIHLTEEIISGNLSVKMLCWEEPLIADVCAIRRREHRLLLLKGCIKALNISLPGVTRALVVCVTFITVRIPWVPAVFISLLCFRQYRFTEGEFNVPDVFLALTTMMLPRLTLAYLFAVAVEHVSEAYVTAKRLDAFFKTPEKRQESSDTADREIPCGRVEVCQGNYGWYMQNADPKPGTQKRAPGRRRSKVSSTASRDSLLMDVYVRR